MIISQRSISVTSLWLWDDGQAVVYIPWAEAGWAASADFSLSADFVRHNKNKTRESREEFWKSDNLKII